MAELQEGSDGPFILLVDHSAGADGMASALDELGFTCHHVRTGVAADEYLSRRHKATLVVLSDLRTDDTTKRWGRLVPIVVLSPDFPSDEGRMADLTAAGARMCRQKEDSLQYLVALIEEVISA